MSEKEIVKEVNETNETTPVETMEAPFVRYEVGIQGTELYNLTSSTEQVSVQDLIQSQAVIELNTIMTLIDSGEGVGTVALYKSIKDSLIVESMKNIIENKEGLDEKTKAELKEFFNIQEEAIEVPAEEVTE